MFWLILFFILCDAFCAKKSITSSHMQTQLWVTEVELNTETECEMMNTTRQASRITLIGNDSFIALRLMCARVFS